MAIFLIYPRPILIFAGAALFLMGTPLFFVRRLSDRYILVVALATVKQLHASNRERQDTCTQSLMTKGENVIKGKRQGEGEAGSSASALTRGAH